MSLKPIYLFPRTAFEIRFRISDFGVDCFTSIHSEKALSVGEMISHGVVYNDKYLFTPYPWVEHNYFYASISNK